MSKLERFFFAIGFALLAVWGAEMLDGIVYSRVALAQFDANQATKAAGSSPAPRTTEPPPPNLALRYGRPSGSKHTKTASSRRLTRLSRFCAFPKFNSKFPCSTARTIPR